MRSQVTVAASARASASASASAARGAGRPRYRPGALPLVIAHRGASGYRPEHTLAAYALAARMGADLIEPDLVSTSDGVLVARHENEISDTTDVADHREFAALRTSKVVDGTTVEGWFTEDFTLAELKTLRAKERLPHLRLGNTVYDDRFQIPTFSEILALRSRLSRELRRPIGVYPETKYPSYFTSLGLCLSRSLVRSLEAANLNSRDAPVFVQSFELMNLLRLRSHHGLRARSVLLTRSSGAPYDLAASGDGRTYASLVTPSGLHHLRAAGIDGLGPAKDQVIPRRPGGSLGTPTTLVDDAHTAGLVVHPYTFRSENTFLPSDYRDGTEPSTFGRAVDEQLAYLHTGIDGLFTDQADVGVTARHRMLGHRLLATRRLRSRAG